MLKAFYRALTIVAIFSLKIIQQFGSIFAKIKKKIIWKAQSTERRRETEKEVPFPGSLHRKL